MTPARTHSAMDGVLQLGLGWFPRSAALLFAFLLASHGLGLLPVQLVASFRTAIGFPQLVCPMRFSRSGEFFCGSSDMILLREMALNVE